MLKCCLVYILENFNLTINYNTLGFEFNSDG